MKLANSPVLYNLLVIVTFFTGGCSSRKDTMASVGMQNLTARYNILYNAKELIRESEKNIEAAHLDDYEQLLSVYKEPTTVSSLPEVKNLDSVIRKMNVLVDEKVKSNYVDDAYFLMGKANYLKSNYFNASEFFNYVYTTYKDEKELKQASLAWKARTLLQLNNLPEAAVTLDTALKYIRTGKKYVADIYAASAQLYIKSGSDAEAIAMLEKALKAEKNKSLKIRWTYLLAQLQERSSRMQQAYGNYTKIIKSNAPFEMAFNASLNRIRIEEAQSGNTASQLERLEDLLKDNKSKEFIDQIYYRIAGIYQNNGEEQEAIKSYNNSIRKSIKNQNQKGLSYMRLAEIYFRNGDYEHAKMYYDSTLTVLATAYPGYEQIRLKSSNLDLLAKNFQAIAREKTLQSLALMSQAGRDLFIDSLLRKQREQNAGSTDTSVFTASVADGKFYFNNPAALSRGLADFKQRWGNRKLEDNWRRSNKTSAELTALAPALNSPAVRISTNPAGTLDSASLRRSYMDNIPLTPAQLDLSNQKIVNSYYDIANFYKDVLRDDEEAINIYQQILDQYPDNTIKPAVYYNLYRLYSAGNPAKSAGYRDILVKQYPGSIFARIILDPDYSRKADEKALELNTAYDEIYNLYIGKKYPEVIAKIAETEQKFGKTSFSAQLAYLDALATGRTQKLDVFERALQKVVQTYPDDKLVTPLVLQNLDYIKANGELISKREFALVDFDPNEPHPVVVEPKTEPVVIQQIPVSSPDPTVSITPPATVRAPVPDLLPDSTRPEIPNSSIFSLPDSSEYYYVVNVMAYGVNLSSSRFGIGQFNRSNYAGRKISHQAQNVNRENQLIFVGPFISRNDVERYQTEINPIIKDIMKIPVNRYNTFIITKSGLDKLSSRNMINSYLEFYTSSTKQ